MDINTIIKSNLITFANSSFKNDILNELIDLIAREENVNEVESIRKKIFYRAILDRVQELVCTLGSLIFVQ